MNSGDSIYNRRTQQTGVALAVSARFIAVALPPAPVTARQVYANWPTDDCELVRTMLSEIIRGKERATPSIFWTPGDPEHLQHVHPHETHIDFPKLDRHITGAKLDLGRMLREAKPRTVHSLADTMAGALKHGLKPNQIVPPHDHELELKVYARVQQLARDGAIEVRKEHHRLHEGATVSMAGLSPALLLSVTAGRDQPALIAELAVQDFTERLRDAVVNVGNDLRRKYSDQFEGQSSDNLGREIEGLVNERSDGFIDVGAVSAARDAMRAGRDDAFTAIKRELEKLGKKIHLVRICAMEKASCTSCKNADGQEVQPGQDLTAVHEGPPETCECMEGEVA